MQDKLLISHTDLASIKGNFSANIEADQVDPYIREAQTGEIRRFLGDELYLQLLNGYTPGASVPPNEQRFEDLMTGEDYTNLRGQLVRFHGLEECLKHWSYYRYLSESDLLTMRFGNRIAEDSIYSTAAFREQVKAQVYHNKNLALKFQSDADEYIRANISTYPEFNNNFRKPKKRSFELNKLPAYGTGERYS